jgi:hypothetical protein
MSNLLELWDLGEWSDGRLPNFGKNSTSLVLKALVLFGGQLRAAHICEGEDERDANRTVVYRIALPLGVSKKFEDFTGYTLSRPDNVGVV